MDKEDKLIDSMIMKSMESVPRVCRMCGCDFVGYKLIYSSEKCATAWQHHCKEMDRKYATHLTTPQNKCLLFYPEDFDEKK